MMTRLREPGDPCVAYAAGDNKKLCDVPPGSIKARKAGCTCPVEDNNYGRGMMPGYFWLFDNCPVHRNVVEKGTIGAIID